MIRILAVLLTFAYALVPPGICACRLQDLLNTDHAEHSSCPDHDEHDCDCPGIQQDCVVAGTSAVESCDDSGVYLSCAEARASSGACAALHTVSAPFRWPAGPPLYLTLRALLI